MSNQPKMMTIREAAKTGILSEHALRLLVKTKRLPALYIGKKALINYDKLCEVLASFKLRDRRPNAQDFPFDEENA